MPAQSTGDAGAIYTFVGYKDGVQVATLDYASTVGVREQISFSSNFDDVDRVDIVREADADPGFVLAFDDVVLVG